MASKHPLLNPPEDGSRADPDDRYQNAPRIVVQGDGRPETEQQQRYDSDSSVSCVSSLTLSE